MMCLIAKIPVHTYLCIIHKAHMYVMQAHISTHAQAHTYTPPHMHTHVHVHTLTHTHTYMYTHTHTHTCFKNSSRAISPWATSMMSFTTGSLRWRSTAHTCRTQTARKALGTHMDTRSCRLDYVVAKQREGLWKPQCYSVVSQCTVTVQSAPIQGGREKNMGPHQGFIYKNPEGGAKARQKDISGG